MKRQRALLLLLLLLTAAACSTHQQQQADKAIPAISEVWFTLQTTALNLHDTGVLTGDKWQAVRGVQSKGSLAMRHLWQIWLTERRLDTGDYGAVVSAIEEIQKIVDEVRN